MSTPVLRYAPPWLVDVASLNATPWPPLSKSSAWIVVVAPDETPKGVPKNGAWPGGGGGGGGGGGLSFFVSANQLRLPTEPLVAAESSMMRSTCWPAEMPT